MMGTASDSVSGGLTLLSSGPVPRPRSAPQKAAASTQPSKYDLARSGVVEGNTFIPSLTPTTVGKTGQGTFKKLLSSESCEIDLTRLSLDEFHELAKGLQSMLDPQQQQHGPNRRCLERLRLRCRHAKALDSADSASAHTTASEAATAATVMHGKHARAVESVARKFETTMVGTQLSKAIARVIRHKQRGRRGLRELELGCSVGSFGLSRIGSAIGSSRSLVRLNLNGSRLGDAGFKLLVDGIRANPMLSELVLSCCRLTDAMAEPLSTIMKSHASHLAIDHWQKNLREYDGNARAARDEAAFSSQRTAGPSHASASAPTAARDGGRGLALLDISNNSFTDHGFSVLCATLEQDELLHTFIIGGNRLSEAGHILLQAIESSRVPKLTIKYDENDDDQARMVEMAKQKRFMASTIARIRTHSHSSTISGHVPASGEARAAVQRPRWTVGGKPGSRNDAATVVERRRSYSSGLSPGIVPATGRPRSARAGTMKMPSQTERSSRPKSAAVIIPPRSRPNRKSKAGPSTKAEDKSLESMMHDMTSLLARLETSVEALDAKKTRKRNKHVSREQECGSGAVGEEGEAISRINDDLKALYGLSY